MAGSDWPGDVALPTAINEPGSLRAVLDAMVDAVSINEAVRDLDGGIVDFRVVYVNAAAIDVAGDPPQRRLGRLWSEAYPDAMGGPFFGAYVHLVETGEPISWTAARIGFVDGNGHRHDGWVDMQAVRFGDGYLSSWRDVTERVRAEELLRRANADLNAAERLAHMGSWHVDAGVLRCSAALAELLGVPADTAVSSEQLRALAASLAPQGVPLLREVIRRVRLGQPFEIDRKVVTADGVQRWLVVRGQPGALGDTAERLSWSGTVQDVTQLRRLRKLVKALRETESELHRERDRLALALAAGQLGRFEWTAATQVVTWDERLEALFGRQPGEFEGTFGSWIESIHPDDRHLAVEVLETTARRGGGAYTFEHRVVLPSGRTAWIEGRGVLDVDEHGTPTGARGVASDVTERKESELALARAREHLAVLDRAGVALTSSLDVETSLRQLGSVLVPAVAEVCEIDLLDAGDDPRRIVVASDARRAAARELAAVPDVRWHPVRRAVATGRAMRLDLRTDPAAFGSPEDPTSPRSMGLRSVVLAPIAVRGDVLGVLSMGRGMSKPPWDDEDVRFVAQLAERAALAIDNGRLFAEQRDLVERLQVALLPEDIPELPWLDLAVRYRAAAAGMHVGGDWYDVVCRRDGLVAISVGDVVGHGVDATVLMSRLRNRLRVLIGEATSAVDTLQRLDAAVAGQLEGDFATVVVAIVDPAGRLRVATAGHPPPLLLDADGARFIDVAATPPVGVGGPSARGEVLVELSGAATVVLFTDGLVERRGESIATGLERLADVTAAGPAGSADELADWILGNMLPSRQGDDVAMAVMRTHRPSTATGHRRAGLVARRGGVRGRR